MTNVLFLYDLLKSSLNSQDSDTKLNLGDLSKVMSLSFCQGGAGVAFYGLRRNMTMLEIEKKALGHSMQVYDKWFATTARIISHRDKILRLQSKLSCQLQQEGIKVLILKGLSIANHYVPLKLGTS